MEKSKIWHDPNEVPAIQYVDIYLLDEDNDIFQVYYDELQFPWKENVVCTVDFVAWAYVTDIVNL